MIETGTSGGGNESSVTLLDVAIEEACDGLALRAVDFLGAIVAEQCGMEWEWYRMSGW